MASKFPNKKEIKIFRPTSKSKQDDGQFDNHLSEEVPEFLARSDDLILKVSAEVIEVTLDDQGVPWDTEVKPKHKNL